MKFKNESGITLVALVITIVILLILAGITINQLTGENGLFARAKQAKQNTIDAQEKENSILEDYLAQINEETGINILANKVNSGEIKIGDYIKYTPDSINETDITDLLTELGTYSGSTENTTETLKQEELNWRVLDVQDGKVRLISEKPTTSRVFLYGYNGYNNGVYLLDKICKKLYNSNIVYNTQSLKIEDIQDKMKIDYTKIDSNYNNTFSQTTYYEYPSILAEEKDQIVNGKTGKTLGLSEQIDPINQTEINTAISLTIKKTYWRKLMSDTDFENSKYYELFIKKDNTNYNSYWMSSRCIDVNNSEGALFGIRFVYAGEVCTNGLYYTNGNPKTIKPNLRPVITLNSNVQIDTTKSGDGTSAEKAYAIK